MTTHISSENNADKKKGALYRDDTDHVSSQDKLENQPKEEAEEK